MMRKGLANSLLQRVQVLTLLIAVLAMTSTHTCSCEHIHKYENFSTSLLPAPQIHANDTQFKQFSAVESLFGQVAKTVVYSTAEIVRLNSRLLCSVMSYESGHNITEQPTLFIFNNPHNLERAYQIYSDDEEITKRMLDEAQFDPNQMTFIYVHGWLGGIHEELWLTDAKSAALRSTFRQSVEWLKSWRSVQGFRPNVIIVDWSQFAHCSIYTATQNSYKVSRRLGRLLGKLVEVGGLRPERMHCLGHSIGTHICGRAARHAFPPQGNVKMGRITGLDPGGFCYELDLKNETTYLGLRPSDATLVDAYYSNRSPFGNKYQVAHYNVRLSNGYFQRACSVWRNPSVATQYFRTAMQFLTGHSHHNDVLACDHYFATRFTHQLLPQTCSYVAYACDSYRNFLRGKCGLCENASQCYSMDFEYQRQNASVEHALDHMAAHRVANQSLDRSDGSPPGSVAYEQRGIYYMQVAQDEPYCSMSYRIRVKLNATALDAIQRSGAPEFKSDWLKLQLIGSEQEILKVRESNRGRLVHSIGLNGPWLGASDSGDDERTTLYLKQYGIDSTTLTALIELAPATTSLLNLAPNGRFLEPPIRDVTVVYDNDFDRRRKIQQTEMHNPIEHIKLDFLSSSDERIRSKNSLMFGQRQFTLLYKHLISSNPQTSAASVV